MQTITIDIPEHLKTKISIKSGNHINIVDLFNMFGIDINYLTEEKKYSKEFFNDVKNNNYIISNKF